MRARSLYRSRIDEREVEDDGEKEGSIILYDNTFQILYQLGIDFAFSFSETRSFGIKQLTANTSDRFLSPIYFKTIIGTQEPSHFGVASF